MINIDPYIQKIEWFKEWIESDFFTSSIYFPEVMKTWGGFIYDGDTGKTWTIKNFDDYCAYKQSLNEKHPRTT